MFFKRLSLRSRSNSYVEEPYNNPSSPKHDRALDSRGSISYPRDRDFEKNDTAPDLSSPDEMYSRTHNSGPVDVAYQQPRSGLNANSINHNSAPLASDPVHLPANTALGKMEQAPDLLTRAFNEALRPYTDKIEMLEQQITDLRDWVEKLEGERREVHSWIDKRGLRPDVPAAIAKSMDSTSGEAATTLSAQLDRKITIVNFDLHRLQDDLNSTLPTNLFTASMAKFLPDIERLSALPSGPRHAFDLILKLGGNLNSHGSLDTADTTDLNARRDFYARLDEAMVAVVRRRIEEDAEWATTGVGREIKRIEKTAAYLRNFGMEPYFPETLDEMRRELEYQQGGRQQQQQQQQQPNGNHSPPRYH